MSVITSPPPDLPGLKRGSEAEPTPSQVRFQALFHELRRRIVLLQLPPGTKLDLDALAVEFDVSRTPLRSVLQRLGDDGLVINRHGVPTMVSEVDVHTLRQAVELRMHLAVLIGELSPVPPQDDDVEELRRLASKLRAVGPEPDSRTFCEINLFSHEVIFNLIGNVPLRQSYEKLFHVTARMWFFLMPQLDWEREVEIFANEVSDWATALERKDVKAVGYLIRNSLSRVLFRLEHLI